MLKIDVRAAVSEWKSPPGRMRRLVLGVVAVVALGTGGTAAAITGYAARTAPLTQEITVAAMIRTGLVIQEVLVLDRENAPSALILAALDVQRGDLMLDFDPRAARLRLEAIGWIASAYVRRDLPGKIHVRLTERRPFAIWQHGGKLAVIDRGGMILTSDDIARFDGLPVVVGPDAGRVAGALMDTLSSRSELLARVRAAVRVGGRRWDLYFESGLVVRLPELGTEDAWQRFANFDGQNAVLAREIESIDLRLTDRLFVRLSPEQAASFGLPAEDA